MYAAHSSRLSDNDELSRLQALTSSSSSWAISRQALHTKLFPVFEQFAHPDTQHTLILILLHALTLTVPLFARLD